MLSDGLKRMLQLARFWSSCFGLALFGFGAPATSAFSFLHHASLNWISHLIISLVFPSFLL
jgi:hypothetical protein